MDTPKFPLQLLAALFLLNLADAALTMYGLSIGMAEANPLYPTQNLWLKLASPLVFAAAWLTAYKFTVQHKLRRHTLFLKILLYALVAFYSAVVAWNIIILTLQPSL
jgi:hypothetical protein